MGLLGSLATGDAPKLNVVSLDPVTKGLINDQISHATTSDQNLSGETNQGVGQAGGNFLQSADQGQTQNAQMGGAGYSDAIRNQYNQVASKNISNVIRNNENQTSIHRSQLLQNAASNAMAQKRVETQNYEMQMKAMMQAEQSRAQILSSVLGLAGVAGGLYAANGGLKGKGGMSRAQERGYNEVNGYEGPGGGSTEMMDASNLGGIYG